MSSHATTSMLISGLPGKMASAVLLEAKNPENRDLFVLPFSLSGDTISEETRQDYSDAGITLIGTDQQGTLLQSLLANRSDIIAVDFTTPDAALGNARLYCECSIPFVMGTTMTKETGNEIRKLVKKSGLYAVVAPNMSVPIVLMQSIFEWAATEFPDVLGGFALSIAESHQAGKKDTSGTARAMMAALNTLGVHHRGQPFTEANIKKIRNPEEQRVLGIPEDFLGGHGWHTYSLDSKNRDVHLELVHNVNGRQTYAEGALRAVRFLAGKWRGKTGTDKIFRTNDKGRVFSMTDILRARK